MSEKIVQLNEEIIKGQIKELVRGSVEETLVPSRFMRINLDGTNRTTGFLDKLKYPPAKPGVFLMRAKTLLGFFRVFLCY